MSDRLTDEELQGAMESADVLEGRVLDIIAEALERGKERDEWRRLCSESNAETSVRLGRELDALKAERDGALLRVAALTKALRRIAHGEQESYLSCPGVPFCNRSLDKHEENCGVGIALAVLSEAT